MELKFPQTKTCCKDERKEGKKKGKREKKEEEKRRKRRKKGKIYHLKYVCKIAH